MECLEIVEIVSESLPFLLIGIEVLMCLFGGKTGFVFIFCIKAAGLVFDIMAILQAQDKIDYYNNDSDVSEYFAGGVSLRQFELVIAYVIFQRVSAVVIAIIVLIFSRRNFAPMLDIPDTKEMKKVSEDEEKKTKWISAKTNLLFGAAWTGGDAIAKIFSISFKLDQEDGGEGKADKLQLDTSTTTPGDDQDEDEAGTTDATGTDATTTADGKEVGTDVAIATDEAGQTETTASSEEEKNGWFGLGFYIKLQTPIGRIICFVLFFAMFVADVVILFELLDATIAWITQTNFDIGGEYCEITDDWILSMYWLCGSGVVGHCELWLITSGIMVTVVDTYFFKKNGKQATKWLGIIGTLLGFLAIVMEIIFVAIKLVELNDGIEKYYTLWVGFTNDIGGSC